MVKTCQNIGANMGYGHPTIGIHIMGVSSPTWIDDHPLVLIDPIMLIMAMDPRKYAHHIHEYPISCHLEFPLSLVKPNNFDHAQSELPDFWLRCRLQCPAA
jgi:hypothetical protein